MGAVNARDRERIRLENGLGCLVQADVRLRAAVTRMVQAARTREEAEVIELVIEARGLVERGKLILSRLHPDTLTPDPSPVQTTGEGR